jgi:hypothetical protein
MPSRRGSRAAKEVLARAAIVYAVLVEKGEATRDELIACVRQALGPDAYGVSPKDSLHNDLAWLERLGFEVGVLPIGRWVGDSSGMGGRLAGVWGWVMGYGDEVEVLAQPELRAELARVGQRFLEMHGQTDGN